MILYEGGCEGSAASGGRSDLSEWQRSAGDEAVMTGEETAGHRNRAMRDIVAL